MTKLISSEKPLSIGDAVMIDTSHSGFVAAIAGKDVHVCQHPDGTGWAMEVETRQIAHVHHPELRHSYTDTEILALWDALVPRTAGAKKVVRFARSLLHGK